MKCSFSLKLMAFRKKHARLKPHEKQLNFCEKQCQSLIASAADTRIIATFHLVQARKLSDTKISDQTDWWELCLPQMHMTFPCHLDKSSFFCSIGFPMGSQWVPNGFPLGRCNMDTALSQRTEPYKGPSIAATSGKRRRTWIMHVWEPSSLVEKTKLMGSPEQFHLWGKPPNPQAKKPHMHCSMVTLRTGNLRLHHQSVAREPIAL